MSCDHLTQLQECESEDDRENEDVVKESVDVCVDGGCDSNIGSESEEVNDSPGMKTKSADKKHVRNWKHQTPEEYQHHL